MSYACLTAALDAAVGISIGGSAAVQSDALKLQARSWIEISTDISTNDAWPLSDQPLFDL